MHAQLGVNSLLQGGTGCSGSFQRKQFAASSIVPLSAAQLIKNSAILKSCPVKFKFKQIFWNIAIEIFWILLNES